MRPSIAMLAGFNLVLASIWAFQESYVAMFLNLGAACLIMLMDSAT